MTTQTNGNGAAVACTLDKAGLATQSERWALLRADAQTERVETADGLLARFRGEPGVEQELRELVAVENECCAWASWAVEREGDHLVMRVASTGEGIVALHGMML